MSSWLNFNALSSAIGELADMIANQSIVPEEARIGLRAAISIIRSTGGEGIIMFLGKFIYMLRNRIKDHDVAFFKGEVFKDNFYRLAGHADFMNEEITAGIHSAFARIHSIERIGKSLAFMKIHRMLLRIIELYPCVIEEYLRFGHKPPYADLA